MADPEAKWFPAELVYKDIRLACESSPTKYSIFTGNFHLWLIKIFVLFVSQIFNIDRYIPWLVDENIRLAWESGSSKYSTFSDTFQDCLKGKPNIQPFQIHWMIGLKRYLFRLWEKFSQIVNIYRYFQWLVDKDMRLPCESSSTKYSTFTDKSNDWFIKIFVSLVRALQPNIKPLQINLMIGWI